MQIEDFLDRKKLKSVFDFGTQRAFAYLNQIAPDPQPDEARLPAAIVLTQILLQVSLASLPRHRPVLDEKFVEEGMSRIKSVATEFLKGKDANAENLVSDCVKTAWHLDIIAPWHIRTLLAADGPGFKLQEQEVRAWLEIQSAFFREYQVSDAPRQTSAQNRELDFAVPQEIGFSGLSFEGEF